MKKKKYIRIAILDWKNKEGWILLTKKEYFRILDKIKDGGRFSQMEDGGLINVYEIKKIKPIIRNV